MYDFFMVVIFNLYVLLVLQYSFRKKNILTKLDFISSQNIQEQQQCIENILTLLVPPFVKTQIKLKESNMEENIDEVAVLFCYICDFDNILKECQKHVVSMLDSLFRVYDRLCLKHGVQKIETVGYTYMAAAGIEACEVYFTEHLLKVEKTRRLVNLGYDMLKELNGKLYGSKRQQIQIKIGIHIGRAIAGVIGYHKP